MTQNRPAGLAIGWGPWAHAQSWPQGRAGPPQPPKSFRRIGFFESCSSREDIFLSEKKFGENMDLRKRNCLGHALINFVQMPQCQFLLQELALIVFGARHTAQCLCPCGAGTLVGGTLVVFLRFFLCVCVGG